MAVAEDYRLKIGFFRHDKTVLLKRLLGAEAVLSLIQLWEYATINKPNGLLSGMSARRIAAAAGWDGDADEFINTLCDPDINYLDATQDGYYLHDWDEHQPWVAGSDDRNLNASVGGLVKKENERRRQNKLPRMTKEEVEILRQNLLNGKSQDEALKLVDTTKSAIAVQGALLVDATSSTPFLSFPFLSPPILSSPEDISINESENIYISPPVIDSGENKNDSENVNVPDEDVRCISQLPKEIALQKIVQLVGGPGSRDRYGQIWDHAEQGGALDQIDEAFQATVKAIRVAVTNGRPLIKSPGAYFGKTACDLLFKRGVIVPVGSAEERTQVAIEAKKSLGLIDDG